MERRSFLRTAAAAVSAAALPVAASEAFAQGQPGTADTIRPVGAGQDRFGERHSLGYSTILFKTVPRETNGGLLIIEHQNLKGGPPVHAHPRQEEWFFVMEGEVLFQLGERRVTLHAGESILGPRGVPHAFSAIGAQPAHMLITFTPAGKMEQFFRDVAVPNGPTMDAALFAKYDLRYVGPPLAG